MQEIICYLGPVLIGINGLLLIINEIIQWKEEKKKNSDYESIKKRWEKAK